MSGRKVVLVACGTGIATSTVVAERVKKLLEDNGIKADVIQCKIAEVASKGADLLVTTSILPRTYSFPVVNAMGYLTGIGTEKIDNEIIKHLKD